MEGPIKEQHAPCERCRKTNPGWGPHCRFCCHILGQPWDATMERTVPWTTLESMLHILSDGQQERFKQLIIAVGKVEQEIQEVQQTIFVVQICRSCNRQTKEAIWDKKKFCSKCGAGLIDYQQGGQ
ncbi:MAG TPA: hypothetical protein VLG12_02055 [Candidatus Saccharimonadales bacterium]|nr:hypothetical protein [Candidatus Saccharimonadales bacterium]